jgi:O-antigen/teichoic acid export membrane protein
VTFPAYSKLQDDMSKLREAYLKVLQVTAFLSFPIAGLIFVLAPGFTKIFLGEKWMPMVPAMMVLVLWGLIRSIGATTGPLFQSIGKPEMATKLQFIQLINNSPFNKYNHHDLIHAFLGDILGEFCWNVRICFIYYIWYFDLRYYCLSTGQIPQLWGAISCKGELVFISEDRCIVKIKKR